MYNTSCPSPYVPPAAAGSINEIAIDMDTTGNAPRVVGTIQNCGEIDSGGTDDLIVGAPRADLPPAVGFGQSVGEAYVIFSACISPWPTPIGDDDCDGFPSSVGVSGKGAETDIGTEPNVRCAANNGVDNEGPPDAWPFDFNDNQRADLGDVLGYIPVFNSFDPTPPYDPRWDLDASGGITLADVLSYIPVFNLLCTP